VSRSSSSISGREQHPSSILRARSWKIIEYLHPIKKTTTHAKEQAENTKINAETSSHGNKLSADKCFSPTLAPATTTNPCSNTSTAKTGSFFELAAEASLQLTALSRTHQSQSKNQLQAITTSLQEIGVIGIHA